MKKILLFLLLGAVSLLTAAECRKHFQAYVGPSEKGEPFYFENKLNNYVITFRYTNPTPNQPAFVLAGMPAPVNLNGFSRYSFMWLTVNGIDSRKLEPVKFEIVRQNAEAGVDVYYNFNGVKMILSFRMDDSSPLLHMQWKTAENVPAGAIKKISINFSVMPCASTQKNNSYSREIATAKGVFKTPGKVSRRRHKLTADCRYLILQDAKYQPGREPKITSAVMLLPDWKSIRSGQGIFGTAQNMSIVFELDPSAGKWQFGLLDSSKSRSNQEFAAFALPYIR